MFHLGIRLLEPRAVTRLLWLAVAVGCVSLAPAQPRAAGPAKDPTPADETTRLLKAQVALAKKGYEIEAELLSQTKRSGNVLVWSGRPAQVYQWSVSWLKAERELSSRNEDKLAALPAPAPCWPPRLRGTAWPATGLVGRV
ncbi:MAG TPA: hypothetical protein VMG10_10190 [Gemmataceae bacterium]|nr:hypothetical protein [Gemmataceae bacterium]